MVIVGGYKKSSVEFLIGDLGTKKHPKLPKEIFGSSMVLHNGTILLCGGEKNKQKCLQLDHGTWKEQSTLNEERAYHSAVTTQRATFLFGGCGFDSSKTYEYLPKDSNTWLIGKTEIPGGFWAGCAIAVKSDQEIWLIGGEGTEERILSFNVNDHSFQVLPSQLNVGRHGHSCAFIQNTNKVMITGGEDIDEDILDSTEILDTEDGSVSMASPMNLIRSGHGMGVVTIHGKEKLAVFGGFDGRINFDSVEIYNNHTGKWETTDIKLKEAKGYFSFLGVKFADLISHL